MDFLKKKEMKEKTVLYYQMTPQTEHLIMLLHSYFRGSLDLNTTLTAFGSGEFNRS